MKAIINGIRVEGTPEEILHYQNLVDGKKNKNTDIVHPNIIKCEVKSSKNEDVVFVGIGKGGGGSLEEYNFDSLKGLNIL